MQYILLIYETPSDFAARSRPVDDPDWSAWRNYHRALVDAGVYIGGSPLGPPDTSATTLRVRGGERHVQDGPYADTKEQIGGFIMLELPSLDAALEWASRCPVAATGAVEVRPALDMRWLFGPHLGTFGRD